jgi:hypothetical protein
MSATATNATMSTEPIKIDYRLSMIAKCRIAFVLSERSRVNLLVPVLRLHSKPSIPEDAVGSALLDQTNPKSWILHMWHDVRRGHPY